MESSARGNVHVSVWWGEGYPSEIDRLQSELQALARAQGSSVGMLAVVEAGAPLVGDVGRRHMMQAIRELGPSLGAVAIVIEGDGFKPAAVRSLFTGVSLAVRPGFPWKMFAHPLEAIEWLILNHGTGVSDERLLHEVALLRQKSPEHDRLTG